MAHTPKRIPFGLAGIPELDYEVTISIKEKKTGKKSEMYYPNVGKITTDHQLTRETAGLEPFASQGMPQALFFLMLFNASPQTGRTLEVKDGGVLGVDTGNIEEVDAELDGK